MGVDAVYCPSSSERKQPFLDPFRDSEMFGDAECNVMCLLLARVLLVWLRLMRWLHLGYLWQSWKRVSAWEGGCTRSIQAAIAGQSSWEPSSFMARRRRS